MINKIVSLFESHNFIIANFSRKNLPSFVNGFIKKGDIIADSDPVTIPLLFSRVTLYTIRIYNEIVISSAFLEDLWFCHFIALALCSAFKPSRPGYSRQREHSHLR